MTKEEKAVVINNLAEQLNEKRSTPSRPLSCAESASRTRSNSSS